jgi:hypothetical protein
MKKPMRHYVATFQLNGQPRALDVISRHGISAEIIVRSNCELPLFSSVMVKPKLRAVPHA